MAPALTSRVFARPFFPLTPCRHSFRIGIPVPSAMTQTTFALSSASHPSRALLSLTKAEERSW